MATGLDNGALSRAGAVRNTFAAAAAIGYVIATTTHATIPSSQKWWPVTTTTRNVIAPCAGPIHRHRLGDTRQTAAAITVAHATWIDGMA